MKRYLFLLMTFLSLQGYANTQSQAINKNTKTDPAENNDSATDITANEDFLEFLLLWEDMSNYQQEKIELLDAIMDNQSPINEADNEK